MRPAAESGQAHAPFILVAAGLALIAVALAAPLARDARAGSTHTIFVNDNNFCGTAGSNCPQPYAIQVAPGAQVEWLDGEPGISHTVTECTANWASCPAPGGFDSGFQNDPPGPYVSESFAEEGVVYYQCQIHTVSMRGLITVGDPSTPTASPSPTPSPSATASPSPTPLATATPSPTAAPSPTATAPGAARSDVNCDGETDGDDVLALLLHRAGIGAPSAAGSCPPLASPEGGETKGDLDCDGVIDAHDAVIALRVWAGLSLDGFVPDGCPAP